MKKTKTNSKANGKANGSETSREKLYLKTLDLMSWWEEFAHDVNKNGTQKYTTVWSFIKKKAKHGWQRDFLYWIIGPPTENLELSEFKAFPQYDWAAKRDNGFWYSSKNIENLRSEIKRYDTSFARLQAAGESLIDDLAELKELQKQVSKEFGGRLFLPNNTASENEARANLFLSMKARIQEMKAGILQTFAKTQGMDMNQLSNFLELFANGMSNAASIQLGYGGGKHIDQIDNEEQGYKLVMRQLVDMTMHKAAELEMELPSEGEKLVRETATGKARRVQ